MKKLIEVSDEGLEGLLGQRITLMCANYFYTGNLVGINDTCVKLEDPAIVYETGDWSDKDWSDAQSLPNDVYVMLRFVESFGVFK